MATSPSIRPCLTVSLTAAALLAPAARAQSIAEVLRRPDWTSAGCTRVSADGTAAVGNGYSATGGSPYIGDQEAITVLQILYRFAIASAVSSDGQFIAGASAYQNGPGTHAIRWTRDGFLQDLGCLSANGTAGATGISADGSVVVGNTTTSTSNEAFRWTQSDGMVPLGVLQSGWFSQAYAVSADGGVIVGGSGSTATYHAMRWAQATGMQDLGLLQGATYSRAYDISAHGLVVVGSSGLDAGGLAFRWTAANGMRSIGSHAGHPYSEAYATNGDGSVIVGAAWSNPAQKTAFIWTSTQGILNLHDHLAALGVNMTGWTLTAARGISANARRVAGDGIHNGVTVAWLADLPCTTCCRADFDCDGDDRTDHDIESFFACLAGNCPPPPCDSTADFNGDGDPATDADIEAFFRVLAGGSC
jgi:probable HAF family extracellular repeat protein